MATWPYAVDPAVLTLREVSPAGLRVKRGDTVVVAESGEPWWIGDVIAVHGGPRDPTRPDFTQVINVDPVGWGRWVDCCSVVAVKSTHSGDSISALRGRCDVPDVKELNLFELS